MEYEENTSLPFNLTTLSQPITEAPSSLTVGSTSTVAPGVLSHFIAGDTPTLYAKPGSDEGKNHKPTPTPSSTFTFFGMPLPSLNLGGFWGSGRNADGAKSRFPGARGRVQQLPGPPQMEKGFLPVVPGTTGGFRPIFNPFNDTESNKIASQADETSGSFLQPTLVVQPQKNELRPQEVNQIALLTALTEQKASPTQATPTTVNQTSEYSFTQNFIDIMTTPFILTSQDDDVEATIFPTMPSSNNIPSDISNPTMEEALLGTDFFFFFN